MKIEKRIGLGLLAASIVLAGSAVPGMAGSNNEVFVLQQSSGGGNTLSIDQSQTSNSLVIGPNDDLSAALPDPGLVSGELAAPVVGAGPIEAVDRGSLTANNPLRQSGTGNAATLQIEGDGGTIQLEQSNQNSVVQLGNTAVVTATGATASTFGTVVQLGDQNFADLTLNGAANGLIVQQGTELSATLSVEDGANGQIIQSGSENQAALNVAAGTSATFVQNGTGLSNVAPVGVFSTTGANVTITQTGF